MKYKRIDLLNLAHEMGVPIKSDKDLIDFESELIINGDLDSADRIDESAASETNDAQLNVPKMVKDIHDALFTSPKNKKSKDDAIAATKAKLILSMAKKRKNKH